MLLNGNPHVQDCYAAYTPSVGTFGRLIALIDRLLAASARISVRNGELPYFGL
jgi:hypothetical protein